MKTAQIITHEKYLNAIREAALSRLTDTEERKVLAETKLVYGRGESGLRGLTMFGAWKNGCTHHFAEICAAGEQDDVQLAGTCIHELAHVLAGHGAGHGKKWHEACAK